MEQRRTARSDPDRGPLPGRPEASDAVDRLAAECIARLGAGETVDVDAVAAQLPDETARRQLRELVAQARDLQSLMPAQVRPGALLKQRYRLLREIGSGGMGKVFEARDCQLERAVAVKVLAALGAGSFDPREQFMQEAVLLASLQHPNIVAAHECATEGDVTFLVMDLVPGVAASEVLERVASATAAARTGPPREGRLLERAIGLPLPAGRASLIEAESWFRSAARIVLEVTRTIEAAHGRGVVHRDIKPNNIMLRGDGSPVVLDFGLAGTLDLAQGTITLGLFGAMGYLAPEQASSRSTGRDVRTDVYQLGLLLYEFLTLRRAFPGQGASSLLARISHGDFQRPRNVDAGIPFELEAICLKAMELDPARRYATARALREDLERYLDGRAVPLAARGGALAARARACRYWARNHKPAIAAALTLALALALLPLAIGSAPGAAAEAVVRGFRYSSAEQRSYFTPESDTVRSGDILGIEIRSAEPQYAYALSVFGAKDPPTFVAPMVLRKLGDPAADSGPAPLWGLKVEPGSLMSCTQVTDQSDVGSYEGLWVFTSSTPQPQLERWMDRLGQIAARSPKKAATFPEARAAFDAERAAVRGEVVRLTDSESARILESLTASSVLGETSWPFTDPKRASFYFRVER